MPANAYLDPTTKRVLAPLKRAPLVIAADHVSLHEVSLPPTPAHRVRAALAGVLEEQLLDDPQDLHFALAPDAADAIESGRSFGVLVCSKTWLTAQCAQAKKAGHIATRIVPDVQELQNAGWDLAQFEFKPRSAWTNLVQRTASSAWHDPAWRLARIGCAVFIVIQLIGLNLWAWHERQALATKRAEIDKILLQTFPEISVVIDAPIQMQRGVAQLRSKSAQLSDKDLESQLAKSKPGAQQIDFAAGQLRITP